MIKPKTEALAFRIWAYASPLGWNCTASQVAEHLGVKTQQVIVIAQIKGWLSRFRVSKTTYLGSMAADYHVPKPKSLDKISEVLGIDCSGRVDPENDQY